MTTRTTTRAPDPTTVPGAAGRPPYGLTRRELRAEIQRCHTNGWQLWEIRRRLAPLEAPEHM
ncbi:hypothetical protein [Streptomyces odonnellii]|uniref:hypothetical protein n=1 Tax=Streptomyces odonnellii TaxID=1417980 RepID=UPI000AE68197|nr:hypothetical protein [Streptomyces odonnellii]